MTPGVLKRFITKVSVPLLGGGCWDWSAAKNNNGYGVMHVKVGPRFAHRAAYEHWRGPLIQGLVIDHVCKNTGCVNPAHLQQVTQRKNVLLGNNFCAKHSKQTHCKRGHEFNLNNTYVSLSTKTPRRQCKACRRKIL